MPSQYVVPLFPFAQHLISWQATHGRHGLPWQATQDPYRVWLSEIMLQQTQVDTVLSYYTRFLTRFPDVAALAAAPIDEVLALWSGLGYYARARNLHKAAQAVMQDWGGVFPRSAHDLQSLPGIGRSTAAVIAAFCYGERAAILDGNVKRVLTRHFGIEGFPAERAVEQCLWALAESLLPEDGVAIYTQAVMDLGAGVCTRSKPRCGACPVSASCVALQTDRCLSLPTPRPRRKPPERSAGLLVLRQSQAVWLERRPASGIWGGLYSLPELLAGEDAAAYVLKRFGLSLADSPQSLPALRHSFTHFTLNISPWLVDLAPSALLAAEGEGRWVPLAELADWGLPAPVRRLLEALA